MPKLKLSNFTVENYDLRKTFASVHGPNALKRQRVYKSADNLVLWAQLDGSPTDYTGTHTLTANGSPSGGTTGEFIKNFSYVSLNSSSKYITVTDHPFLSFSNGTKDTPLTISIWIKRSATDTWDTVIHKGTDDAEVLEYQIVIKDSDTNGDAQVRFKISDSSLDDPYLQVGTENNVLTGGTWQHIAVTYDGLGSRHHSDPRGSMKIYINGIDQDLYDLSDANADDYIAMDNGSSNLFLGRRTGSTNTYAGDMAELAMWNKALDGDEIYAIYAASMNGMITNWHSGIISEPPRARLRRLDSVTGSYPTVLRSGDPYRSGKYTTAFNDQNTLVFGRKIHSDFTFDPQKKDKGYYWYNIAESDSNWTFSEGMQIRYENRKRKRRRRKGQKKNFKDGALVFCGTGTDGERYIQTTKPVSNVELEFILLQGPYNKNRTILGAGLGLREGATGDSLKIQISRNTMSDSPTWRTIKEFNVTNAYDYSTLTTRIISGLPDFHITLNPVFSSDGTSTYTLTEAEPAEKTRIRVHMGMSDFPADEGAAELTPPGAFLLRVAQTSISDTNIATWAIGKITVKSSNDKVSYPLMVNKDTYIGKKIEREFVSYPNILPDISAYARSLPGISDTHITFTKGQNITPFDESNVIEDATNDFYDEGVDPNVYPGFSSKLSDKVKVSIDLTPDHHYSDYFGVIYKMPETNSNVSSNATPYLGGTDGSNGSLHDSHSQPLMVFWNNDLKRWQKQGGGVEPGINVTALGGGSGLATDFSSPIAWMFNNGLCGFGPMGPIMTGSSTTKTTHEFIDPAVLGAYVRPVEQWGFPFSARYHMTSSNIVKARDLGIHQPFLFEKAVLDFGAVFEFPEASFPSKAYSHRYTYGTDDSPAVTTQAGFQQVVPTFFMLRQMPGQRRHMQTIYVDRTPGAAITPAGGGSYQVDGWDPVPNTKKVGHGARGLPYGNRWSHETRELITYGQLVIAQSGSHGYSQFTTEDFMNNIGRDGGGFYNFADSEIDYTLTGSFRIEFPCRTTAKYPAGTVGVKLYGNTIGTSVGGSGVANKYMARLGNETYGGRATGNSGDFTSGRSLVNGLAPITPAGDGSEEVAIHGPVAAEKFIHFQKVKAESYDQASPYIILPDDDLILGWQYPLSFNLTQEPGSDSVKVNRMALSGSAKLHLYGSNILMNKETTTNSLNQLLTSDAVHEIIGAEPIYDRFYVEGRDAYTGSYVDQLLAADAAKDAVGRLNDVLLQTRPDGSGNIGDVIVGVQSIVGYDPYETHQTNRSLTGSFQRHVTLTDGTRVYYDSQFSNGHFYGAGYVAERPNFRYDQFKLPHDPSETLDTDNTVDDGGEYDAAVPYTGSRGHKMWQDSSYGTMQTTSAGSSSPNTWRPKYNFSMNHFGHYADMIKQARDSKTVSIFTGGGIAGWLSRRRPQAKQTIESPVQVRFVSGGLVDDARLKCYYMDSRPPNMFYTTASSETGLDQVIYTKGNMSQESTASFGWSESGTGASVNTPFYFNWFDIATMTPGAYAVSTVVSNLAAWGSTSPTVVTRQFDL